MEHWPVMTRRRDPNSELDLFIPLLHDVPLKDQRETMERPFFSLQKRKRLKPIEYRSPDGDVWVKVEAMPAYGMATIWDADILIWAASALARMKAQGVNDLPRTLKTTTYDLLRAIKRDTGGKAYAELQAALQRLETTSIRTSLRAPTRRTEAQFGWLDGWTLEIDQATGQPRGMTLTLSNWVYEGIVGDRSLLTMHSDYFLLTGGLERSLYRIARKHAGVQPEGWLCRLEILHTKTGSDSPSKEFNRMLRKVVERNQLPEYDLKLTTTQDGSPALFVISRMAVLEEAVTSELSLLNARDGLPAPAAAKSPKTLAKSPTKAKARSAAQARATAGA